MKTIKYGIVALLLLSINAVKADTNSAINKVLTAYLDIKNALADDDNKLANQKALAFIDALIQVNYGKLYAKQKTTWLKYSEKLRYDGDHIARSAAIAHQREHFTSLSKNMYTVLKQLKVNASPVYIQYCPMKKASWLSESEAIKNPYYGKSMSDCGKVTETLKAADK